LVLGALDVVLFAPFAEEGVSGRCFPDDLILVLLEYLTSRDVFILLGLSKKLRGNMDDRGRINTIRESSQRNMKQALQGVIGGGLQLQELWTEAGLLPDEHGEKIVIAGSSPLNAAIGEDYSPNDVDIFLPRLGCNQLVSFLMGKGYVLDVKEVTSGEARAYYTLIGGIRICKILNLKSPAAGERNFK
jgi:hypothetical protein